MQIRRISLQWLQCLLLRLPRVLPWGEDQIDTLPNPLEGSHLQPTPSTYNNIRLTPPQSRAGLKLFPPFPTRLLPPLASCVVFSKLLTAKFLHWLWVPLSSWTSWLVFHAISKLVRVVLGVAIPRKLLLAWRLLLAAEKAISLPTYSYRDRWLLFSRKLLLRSLDSKHITLCTFVHIHFRYFTYHYYSSVLPSQQLEYRTIHLLYVSHKVIVQRAKFIDF